MEFHSADVNETVLAVVLVLFTASHLWGYTETAQIAMAHEAYLPRR